MKMKDDVIILFVVASSENGFLGVVSGGRIAFSLFALAEKMAGHQST